MKQRFSALDVSASVAELAPRLVGMRLQNIYDINPKTYLFKFTRAESKELLLIESGIRMHTTQFARDKSTMPSGFCMKLRKHLRTRRLISMRQLGADRAIDMQFSEGEYAFHVIVELYSSGNILLTDYNYRILSLLRMVEIEGAPAAAAATVVRGDSADGNAIATATADGAIDAAKTPKDADTVADTRRIAVGETYNVQFSRPFEPMTSELLLAAIQSAASENDKSDVVGQINPADAAKDVDPGGDKQSGKQQKGKNKKAKKGQQQQSQVEVKKRKSKTIKSVLRERLGLIYGPTIVEHCIIRSGIPLNTPLPDPSLESTDSESFAALLAAFKEGDTIMQTCMQSPQPGFIILSSIGGTEKQKREPSEQQDQDGDQDKRVFVTYSEFHPYLYAQFAGLGTSDPVAANTDDLNDADNSHKATDAASLVASPLQPVKFESFDKCVDEFFSKLESQRLEMRARQAEAVAAKRLEGAKTAHLNQIRSFQIAQEENQVFAMAIEYHLDVVESVLQTVRSFIASGMDWVDLENLVQSEAARGNPLAKLIAGFKLNMGIVTVALRNPIQEDSDDDTDDDSDGDDDDSDDDEDAIQKKQNANRSKTQKSDASLRARKDSILKIDLDIYISAHSNARRYYDAKKVAAVKEIKTIEASTRALKSTELRIKQDLTANQQAAPVITKIRMPFWFEKFLWFVSSENYLVVGGRDATQNEMLVRRYLEKGDVYVHADMHGAATVIVKNVHLSTDAMGPPVSDEFPIPPTTLLQAGTMSVCQSRAWDAKIVTSAYWVHSHQVSKTAPTGEYLTTGAFMIRGKKNWLPPIQLVYGMGLLFKVDETSVARHYWERRPWGRDGTTDADAVSTVPLSAVSSRAGDVEGDLDSPPDGDNDNGSDGNDEMPREDVNAINVSDVAQDDSEKVVDEHRGGGDGVADEGYVVNVEAEEEQDDDDDDMEFPDTQVESMLDAPEMPSDPNMRQSADSYPADLQPEDGAGDGSDDSDRNDQQTQGDGQSQSGKKYLSAKERRQMRKQKQGGGAVAQEPQSQQQPTASPPPKKKAPTPAPIEQPNVRGKRGKIKKMREKYGDQSDEERALVLDFLGSSKGPQPKGKKAKAQQARKAEEEARKQRQQEQQKRLQQRQENQQRLEQDDQKKQDQGDRLDGDDNDAASATVQKRSLNGDDDIEVKRMLEEENVAVLDHGQKANLSYLDSMTGQPHPDDILLHAIPVCAPWTALQKYKYKVKLMPGSLKRGKAAKSVQSAFAAMITSDASNTQASLQKELLRAVPDPEWIATILAKVKVVVSAADQEAMKKSSSKKGGARRQSADH